MSWKVLASYEPIFVNIYHEYHMFHKNVLEIREPMKDSPRRKSEEYREAYLNACRVIVAGSRGFFEYDLMSRELDKLFNESKEFTGRNIKIILGMADGADSLAIRYADERKLTKILFPAIGRDSHVLPVFYATKICSPWLHILWYSGMANLVALTI